MFLKVSYPPWLNSLISLTQYYFYVDCCSNVDSNFFSNIPCSSGGILSLRYFFKILVPPFLMFCLIVLSGFPYTWSLTKELIKPSSYGSSARSLFSKSKVFNFCNFKMSFDIFVSLLFDNIRTVRFGQFSKWLYSFKLLYAKFIVSNF